MSADSHIEMLARDLRRERPRASEALQDRIAAIAARESTPSAPRLARLPVRRAALLLVPACVAAGLGVAIVRGVVSASSPATEAVGGTSTALLDQRRAPVHGRSAPGAAESSAADSWNQANPGTQTGQTFGALDLAADKARALRQVGSPLPPSGTRLQAYDADLKLRVRDNAALSSATRQAMRVARSLGGHVAAVSFNTPGSEGTATLRLRVPIGRVQEAVARFSSLGTLVAQQFRIEDLQRGQNRRSDRIVKLRGRIDRLNAALRGSLTAEARARIAAELAGARRALGLLTRQNRDTLRRARLARVSLALTTQEEAAAAPKSPGRIGRALDDAGAVLAKEIAWTLYLLVVLAPLLLLAGLVLLAAQLTRRRGDRVLLERP